MFIRVAEDPDGVAEAEMRGAERVRDVVRPFVEAGVDGVSLGQDYGYNSGPFVSPATFAKIYAPALRRRCEILHEMGMPNLFHSCGNNRLILDQMVDAGMDAYQAGLMVYPQTGILNGQCQRYNRPCEFAGYCEAIGFGSRMLKGFKPRLVAGEPYVDKSESATLEGETF